MAQPTLLARHVERRPCEEHGHHNYNIEIWRMMPGMIVQRIVGGHDTKPIYSVL